MRVIREIYAYLAEKNLLSEEEKEYLHTRGIINRYGECDGCPDYYDDPYDPCDVPEDSPEDQEIDLIYEEKELTNRSRKITSGAGSKGRGKRKSIKKREISAIAVKIEKHLIENEKLLSGLTALVDDTQPTNDWKEAVAEINRMEFENLEKRLRELFETQKFDPIQLFDLFMFEVFDLAIKKKPLKRLFFLLSWGLANKSKPAMYLLRNERILNAYHLLQAQHRLLVAFAKIVDEGSELLLPKDLSNELYTHFLMLLLGFCVINKRPNSNPNLGDRLIPGDEIVTIDLRFWNQPEPSFSRKERAIALIWGVQNPTVITLEEILEHGELKLLKSELPPTMVNRLSVMQKRNNLIKFGRYEL